MTQKQHVLTLFKPLPQNGTFKSLLREIVAHLKQAVEIPTGYQDEDGFHFGAEPVKAQIQWPQA